MSLSSFGAIAGGINQGMDMNRRDEQLKEQLETSRQNRQVMADQNEYLKQQRERNRKQQARDDAFTEESAAIIQPGEYKGEATDEGPSLGKRQTQASYARDLAGAYARKGDVAKSNELFRWADEAESKNAAQGWVQNLYSLPRNASLEEVARVAGSGVDADSSPVGVDTKNMRKNDDGSVTVRLYNKLTGASQERTFGSVGDLKEALTWHYAPDYAKSLYDKRLQAEQELQKNPVASVPDGYYDKRTGQFVRTRAAGDQVIGYNSEGEPIYGKGSSAGAGAGGKAPKTAQSVAIDFFATAAEKAETKLTPTQIAYGQRVAEQISTQRGDNGQPIPPAIAAEVAMEVALDPAKIQPQVNVRTGKIEGVFSRRDLGDVVVQPWSPALQKSFTPEQLTKAAEELVKAQPDDVRAEFVKAAHDPGARKAFVEKVVKKIEETVPPDQVQAYTQSTVSSLTEKLDIVAKNTKPPKPKRDTSYLSMFGFRGGMRPPEPYSPRQGVPDDLARRATQANDAASQRAAEQAARRSAEAKASEERKAALEQEISWLTEAEVRAMSPSEAAGYLRKYESVLSPSLQRALRRRQ